MQLAASRGSELTFRLVLVFACSLISYSPVTRTSLWISSRKHFLELTGKKNEMENTDSIRTGNSSSTVSRAIATLNRSANQPLPANQLNAELRAHIGGLLRTAAPPLAWRENYIMCYLLCSHFISSFGGM